MYQHLADLAQVLFIGSVTIGASVGFLIRKLS